MTADHKGEYARSSGRTGDLRVAKEQLYAEGFPVDKTRAVAAEYFQADKYSHLRGRPELTFLVAPSTSGQNTLPVAVAQLLKENYGGRIVTSWATPEATRRTATMDGITKLQNPPRYQLNDEVIKTIPKNATLVLVDDVVTTGGSINGMRESLAHAGMCVHEVTSLAQSEMRLVRDADIDRITDKLIAGGAPSERDPLRRDVALVLDGKLKHFANYIETSTRKTDANRNSEISSYFHSEAQRLRELGRTDAGAILGIAERIERLDSIQSRNGERTTVLEGIPREGSSVRTSVDRSENETEVGAPMASPQPSIYKGASYEITVVPGLVTRDERGEPRSWSPAEKRDAGSWILLVQDTARRHPQQIVQDFRSSAQAWNAAQDVAAINHPLMREMIARRSNDEPEYVVGMASYLAGDEDGGGQSDHFRRGKLDAHDMVEHLGMWQLRASPAAQLTRGDNELTQDTKAVLSRLDALRLEYEKAPTKETVAEAREALDELDGPDVSKVPFAVAAQEYVTGSISRVDLEIAAAENDRAREARALTTAHQVEHSDDKGMEHGDL